MDRGNQKQPPKPTAQHARLDVFVGRWKAEGKSYGPGKTAAEALAKAVPWVGEETFEWLPGGFFLSHRWAADLAGADFQGLEVIGCDEQGFFSRMFENHGYSPSYEIKSAGDTWTFTGEAQRGTIQVDSPDKMTIRWELKVDANWVPLCDRVHTRSN